MVAQGNSAVVALIGVLLFAISQFFLTFGVSLMGSVLVFTLLTVLFDIMADEWQGTRGAPRHFSFRQVIVENCKKVDDQISRLLWGPIPGGFKVHDTVYYLGETQTLDNGDSLIYGGRGNVTGASQWEGYVVVTFGQNKQSTHCRVQDISRQPAGPIPGGYQVHDTVYYLGETQTLDNGDSLIYGGRGNVTGASQWEGYVVVTFGQNKCGISFRVQDLSKQPAGPIPGGFQVYDVVSYLSQTNGDRGTVTGASAGYVVVNFDKDQRSYSCRAEDLTKLATGPAPGRFQAPTFFQTPSHPRQQTHEVFHGTSMTNALSIQRSGFRPSSGGCLGVGVYLAARSKAARFGHDKAPNEPAMLRCQITVSNPKRVSGDDCRWQSEGHDSCFADRTSRSTNSEWCVRSPNQIRILEIIDLKGTPRP